MQAKGSNPRVARSGERSGSYGGYARKPSPGVGAGGRFGGASSYKPPVRNNFVGGQGSNTRVSPGAPRLGA